MSATSDLPDRIMSLFRGFESAHGTYEEEEFNPEKNKNEIKKTAKTLRQPVTLDLWQRHLRGEYHLGVITISEKNQCNWAAIDVDDYTVSQSDLVQKLESMKIPALVCRTKSGGAHVFLFFSEPIPASDVMPKLQMLAASIGYGTAEVFPKQMRVATELEGMGNWLNMPYFAGDKSRNYGIRADGLGMSLRQFVEMAEKGSLSREAFLSLKMSVRVEGWEEAPPCLVHLASAGVQKGMQNNALFNFAVYARKLDTSDNWTDRLYEWGKTIFTHPNLPPDDIKKMATRIAQKEYHYKCHEVPCANHCNLALCRTRKFGVGASGGADIISSISYVDTEPPLFLVTLRTGGAVECFSQTLLSPREFQKAVLDQAKMLIPQYKQDTWLPQIQRSMEAAVKIESSPEVGVTGQFNELLERFCTDRHAATQRDEILLGKPWRDEEASMVWFRLRDLAEFLERAKFNKLGSAQVTERIKRLGGTTHFFNISGSGVNVWGVPTGALAWRRDAIPLPVSEDIPL